MDPFSCISAVCDAVELIDLAWRRVQEELKLAQDAERELRILMEFNGMMGCLLNEAYSKEVTDEQLKRRIKRTWEFFFDSEDAIEDFRRRESKCKGKGPASFLRHHRNKRTFTVESRDIKRMWKGITADLGITTPTETSNGLTIGHAQSSSAGDDPIDHAQSSSAGHGSSSDTIFDKTDNLVGIEGPMNELVQCLITGKSSKPKMIFVHGVQGVGKTSLVAAVLRNKKVKSHFKYCVWMDLRSWELAGNTEAALMAANTTMWTLTQVNRQGRLIQLEEAFRQMKKNVGSTANKFSWVLVLDDVGRADVFRSLRRHLIENPPSVLVTTRVRRLESSSPDYLEAQYDLHNFEHVVLSENDSRSLLCRKMKDLQSECEKSPTLEDASDHILRRCRGLPLAILATCRLLKSNNQCNVSATPHARQWKDWSGRLEEELLSKGHVVDASGRKITLRLNHLMDVRDCLFYLSIFPLDRPIRCSTLMRLWMAEGFIKHEGSKPVQEKAKDTLKKLLEHNVIREKRTSYGTVKTGRVHNLLHQIIISKLKDEAFTMIVADPEERLPENVRYLSFHSPMGKTVNGTSVKQLRSLHFFKTVHPPSLKNLLEKVERLKVLDFQRYLTETEEEKKYDRASLNTFPRKILQSKYLRYLSLRGTNIKIIPNGIEDLAYLESLDLKGTLVDELPKGILKLKALRHLLVSRSNRSWPVDTDPTLAIGSNRSRPVDTDPTLAIGSNRSLEVGVKAPSKLGDLTLLQKLCTIELKAVEGGSQHEREQLLEELEKLTNLQRLGLSMLKSTDAERLCSSIEKLTNLVALRLIAAPEAKIDLSKNNMRQALKRLERIHLTGCLGTLPEGILGSDNLVKLVLKRSQLTIDALQQLGNLPRLEHLELEQAFDVTDMRFEKFQKLRFLGLDGFDKLESIQVDEGALPALERLFLAQCNSLTTVPPFIIHPTKLKCLELCGMHKEFDKAIMVLVEELRKHMKVKFKKWKAPDIEKVQQLPTRGAGIRSALRQCMK